MRKGKVSIKYKIIISTMLIVASIMIATSVIIYIQNAKALERQGLALTESIRIGMENALKARMTAEQILNEEMIGQATIVSLLQEKGTSYDELKELAARSGLDEFWITDEKGKTILTNMAPTVDFSFAADPQGQAYEFIDLLSGKRKEVSQPAMYRGVDGKFYKFVGVPGWSAPAIVQVGRDGQRLLDLENEVGVKPLIEQMKGDLGQQVLLTTLVEQSGNISISSDPAYTTVPPELLDTLNQSTQAQTIAIHKGTYKDTLVTYYVAPLSNGQGLVLAISNDLLTEIQTISIIAVVSGLALTFLILFFVISRVMRPVLQLRDSLLDIVQGEGDLTQRLSIESKDEIGESAQAFNLMLSQIQQMVRQIKEKSEFVACSSEELVANSDQTKTASEQIARTIHEIAEGSHHQLETIEGSSDEISKMNQQSDQVAANIQAITTSAQETSEKATKGNQAIQSAIKQIQSISGIVQELSALMDQLGERSGKIGEITQLINGIAQQTNLLALNAAIEAARAGEHGRGFAVVADEVRKLAEQSANATEQIAELISGVQLETHTAMKSMDSVTKEVDLGIHIMNTAEGSFDEIRQSFQTVTDQILHISSAVLEMTAGLQRVEASIKQIVHVAEETAAGTQSVSASAEEQLASMEEVAAASDGLTRVAEELKLLTDQFKV